VALVALAVPAGLFAEPAWLGLHVWLSRYDIAVALPHHPPPRNDLEATLQDIADLKLLPEGDRSFSPEARSAFDHQADALAARAGSPPPPAFALDVARLVALAGNGHTTVNLVQRAARFGRAPLRFAWFAEGLFIVRATPAFADLLGRRVISIDGRPVDAAFAAVRPYFSGTEQRARAECPPLLESPPLLQVLWPDTDGRTLSLEIETQAADPKRRDLPVLAPVLDKLAGQPVRAIMPFFPAGDRADWVTVLDTAPQTPLALREPERVAYSAPLERNGLYVRINANGNDRNGRLVDQLAAIGDGAPAGGWRWIVLDLRFNDGGDELKTAPFTRRLPDLLGDHGNLWILTDGATFSAAIITAARARYFAGPRAHIVGETAGDHARFWTDGGAPLVLRNSGIEILHAYFLQDWSQGCYAPRDCHPNQYIYGVAAGDLSPEITVGWRFVDYAAGLDTLLERVRALEALR